MTKLTSIENNLYDYLNSRFDEKIAKHLSDDKLKERIQIYIKGHKFFIDSYEFDYDKYLNLYNFISEIAHNYNTDCWESLKVLTVYQVELLEKKQKRKNQK